MGRVLLLIMNSTINYCTITEKRTFSNTKLKVGVVVLMQSKKKVREAEDKWWGWGWGGGNKLFFQMRNRVHLIKNLFQTILLWTLTTLTADRLRWTKTICYRR